MLLSLVLYGSRARGDFRLNSDIDLLGVVESNAIARADPARATHLHLYPISTLMEKSRRGDLFLLHLVKEGRVLHDTAGIFESVKSAFALKESYNDEIRQATLICLFILDNRHALDLKSGRSRLVWSIRTILIANAANEGLAVFSARRLEERFSIEHLKEVIDKKNVLDNRLMVDVARSVLTRFGDRTTVRRWPHAKLAQIALLQAQGSLGKSTVGLVYKPFSALDMAHIGEGYEISSS